MYKLDYNRCQWKYTHDRYYNMAVRRSPEALPTNNQLPWNNESPLSSSLPCLQYRRALRRILDCQMRHESCHDWWVSATIHKTLPIKSVLALKHSFLHVTKIDLPNVTSFFSSSGIGSALNPWDSQLHFVWIQVRKHFTTINRVTFVFQVFPCHHYPTLHGKLKKTTYICIHIHFYTHICIYLRIHVCICVYMYIYVSICMYMCLYVSICVYMYVYVSICMYMCLYVSICVYMYVYVSICIYLCMCIYEGMFITVFSREWWL